MRKLSRSARSGVARHIPSTVFVVIITLGLAVALQDVFGLNIAAILTGPLNLGGNKITNVGNPTLPGEVATKGWVESATPNLTTPVSLASASDIPERSTFSSSFVALTTFNIPVTGNRLVKGLSWRGEIKSGAAFSSATFGLFTDPGCTRQLIGAGSSIHTGYVTSHTLLEETHTSLLLLGFNGNIVVYVCGSGSSGAFVKNQTITIKYSAPGDYLFYGSISVPETIEFSVDTVIATTFTLPVTGNRLVKAVTWSGSIASMGAASLIYYLSPTPGCKVNMAATSQQFSSFFQHHTLKVTGARLLHLGAGGNIVLYGCPDSSGGAVKDQRLDIFYTKNLVDVIDSPLWE